MNIKTELIKNYISDFINSRIENFDIDAIEEIINIFEKHNIDCGFRHDF